MTALKKYTSFEGLKQDARSNNGKQAKSTAFSEFEAFLKKLQAEYSNQKNNKKQNGKQPNR